MTATLAETAAEYARRGIAVLALHPARKEPAGEVCPHGNDDATTDTDQVRAWWEHNPDYNIGIRPPPGAGVSTPGVVRLQPAASSRRRSHHERAA